MINFFQKPVTANPKQYQFNIILDKISEKDFKIIFTATKRIKKSTSHHNTEYFETSQARSVFIVQQSVEHMKRTQLTVVL
ncbi:hypothetical protein HMPREF1987_00080 [Peptostreptococcaceae bacterium oral taxon 113 str. W5053]|nr:hypothetical protein HMPREF1987_00080 [Peptostreptococcaceae bacterium oral taxon 113 str. W5053]